MLAHDGVTLPWDWRDVWYQDPSEWPLVPCTVVTFTHNLWIIIINNITHKFTQWEIWLLCRAWSCSTSHSCVLWPHPAQIQNIIIRTPAAKPHPPPGWGEYEMEKGHDEPIEYHWGTIMLGGSDWLVWRGGRDQNSVLTWHDSLDNHRTTRSPIAHVLCVCVCACGGVCGRVRACINSRGL